MSDPLQTLGDLLHGRVALLCVGNALRGDDGAGPALAARLALAPPWRVFDAGVAPENWIGPVRTFHPNVLLVVDTIDFQQPPGSLRCWPAGELADVGASTHHASLSLTVRLIQEDTGATAHLLGIQPAAVGLGQPLTAAVEKAVRRVAAALTHLNSVDTAQERG